MTIEPIALIDLRASCRRGKIHLTWQCPPKAPDTVHIFPCDNTGAGQKLDTVNNIAVNLGDYPEGYAFAGRRRPGCDVRRETFCVYLANRGESAPDIRALQGNPGCFVSVIAGEANVSFDIKKKPMRGAMAQYKIWVGSDAEIDAGILGYSYSFDEKEMTVSFPGIVTKGLTEYPPVFLVDAAAPVVGIIGGSYTDVSVIQTKYSLRKRMFQCKKKTG